jgi:triosephosphate isomerase
LSELKSPAIIINFKTYREVEGAGALALAIACQDVAKSSGVHIAVCPPTVELARIAAAVHNPVLAQHTDAKSPGSNTGWTTAESVKACGAAGTLLNHSEHRLMMYDISASVAACHKAGLATLVCADSPDSAAAVAHYHPRMVAVEPPELIGGDISVTTARPEVVSEAVEAVRAVDAHIPVLCGAGVKDGRDVRKAMELGAQGVLLASGVVKAKDVRKVLEDLASGM